MGSSGFAPLEFDEADLGSPSGPKAEVALCVRAGETVALQASEALCHHACRTVTGDEPVLGGSVRIFGRDVSTLSAAEHEQLRHRTVGIVTGNPVVHDGATLIENATLTADFVGLPTKESRELAAQLIAEAGLAAKGDVRAHDLLLSERHWAALIRVLVPRPRLVLVEPGGFDFDRRVGERMLRLFADYCADTGAGGFVATANTALACLSPTMYTIRRGRALNIDEV